MSATSKRPESMSPAEIRQLLDEVSATREQLKTQNRQRTQLRGLTRKLLRMASVPSVSVPRTQAVRRSRVEKAPPPGPSNLLVHTVSPFRKQRDIP